MTWTVVDWVMVFYPAVGVGIEVWRWPRERELRADLVRDVVKRRTRQPDWRSRLRRQVDPNYTEEARARDDVRAFVAYKVLLWPVFLLLEPAVRLTGAVQAHLLTRGRR